MLDVTDLKFAIGETEILNGITMSVADGETVGLIGPNGSGKTTLFNCISGFNFAQQGNIKYRGADITSTAPHLRSRAGLGRVFQNFGIFREMTVLENMITALEGRQNFWKSCLPWSSATKINKKMAMEFLAEAGLQAKANNKAGSLSGGQLRLLEIVRTLAFGADLFLLDEPTAGVSPKMKDEVSKLICHVQSLGKSVLVIEHDINFIQKFCHRIVVLDSGKVVLDDTPDKVRQNERLKEIYFGNGE